MIGLSGLYTDETVRRLNEGEVAEGDGAAAAVGVTAPRPAPPTVAVTSSNFEETGGDSSCPAPALRLSNGDGRCRIFSLGVDFLCFFRGVCEKDESRDVVRGVVRGGQGRGIV